MGHTRIAGHRVQITDGVLEKHRAEMEEESKVTETAIATRPPSSLARRDELTIEDMVAQVEKVHLLMKRVMKEDEHYGVIPGTSSKPSLFKPGAEKLCMMFRLDPQYAARETVEGRHLTIESTCTLYHIPTGERWGSGMGSCSTKESKYAYRQGKRLCPKCGQEHIRKSKDSGWYCWRKIGGCGAQFKDGDQSIEGQSVARVANEDLADQYNTVLKMANKRALVAAVLNVTAASDIFTQDLEDLPRTTPPTTGEVIDLAPEPEPTVEALFPDPETEERQTILNELFRMSKALNLGVKEREAYKLEYLGAADADVLTADLAGLKAMKDDMARKMPKS